MQQRIGGRAANRDCGTWGLWDRGTVGLLEWGTVRKRWSRNRKTGLLTVIYYGRDQQDLLKLTLMKFRSHRQLEVFTISFETAMTIYELTKTFPREERYSLVDQMRRSSRSVSANVAEAFRKRRYPLAFVSKLNEAEAEAAETQVWLDYSHRCGYISEEMATGLKGHYDSIIGKLVTMSRQPQAWVP